MNAFMKFNRGLMRSPLPVRIWLMFLMAVNMVAPLFFVDRLEAQVTIAALMASMVLMTIITGLTGFTRLLGAGHVFWVPMLFWLVSRLDQAPLEDPFGAWLRALILINSASLVIDIIDVFRYVRGERSETVSV